MLTLYSANIADVLLRTGLDPDILQAAFDLQEQRNSGVAAPTPGRHITEPHTATSAAAPAFPTAQEIYAAIPANGISIPDFLRLFNRFAGRRNEFYTILKNVAWLAKDTMLLMPKATAPAP